MKNYRIPKLRLVQDVHPEPDWPEHGKTLDGASVVLANVPRMPADDRANVFLERADGSRVFPWREAGEYVDAATGKPFWQKIELGQKEMTREALLAMGITDEQLTSRYSKTFPKKRALAEQLDPHGDTTTQRALRRLLFDEWWAVVYA